MVYIAILIILILCWFSQSLLHEGAHLLFAYLFCGYTPVDIIPWPRKEKGRIIFAESEYLINRFNQ